MEQRGKGKNGQWQWGLCSVPYTQGFRPGPVLQNRLLTPNLHGNCLRGDSLHFSLSSSGCPDSSALTDSPLHHS